MSIYALCLDYKKHNPDVDGNDDDYEDDDDNEDDDDDDDELGQVSSFMTSR